MVRLVRVSVEVWGGSWDVMVLPQPKVGQNLPDFLGREAQCLAGWTVEPSAQLSECLAGWAVEPSVCLPECWGQAKTHSEAV